MTWFEEFTKAYNDYPTQDNEGFVPDRGGFKCGFGAAWEIQQREIDRLLSVNEVHVRCWNEAEEKLAVAVEALEKIAVPSSIETSGLGDADEFEKLYDFWHYSSSKKLYIAQEALSKIRGDK